MNVADFHRPGAIIFIHKILLLSSVQFPEGIGCYPAGCFRVEGLNLFSRFHCCDSQLVIALANLAQGIFGGGCRAIDPPGLASILGTQALPQQNELLTAMLRARLGGCPNIDPANQLSMLGTLAQLAATPAAAAQRPASSGCPNIDPANIGTLVGTLVQLAARPQANAFANLFGGGCPNIDPVQIGSMLGTLAALGGLRS